MPEVRDIEFRRSPQFGTQQLKFLSPAQVEKIDEAMANLGPWGEIRLVVQKGRLRFLVTQQSHDALLWEGKRDGPPEAKAEPDRANLRLRS